VGLAAPVRRPSHMMDPAAEDGSSPNQNSPSGIVGAWLSVSSISAWAEGKGELRRTRKLAEVRVGQCTGTGQCVIAMI